MSDTVFHPWYEDRPTQPGVDPSSIRLVDIDVSSPDLYKHDAWRPFFKRLRDEDPVHYCAESFFGPYWSVTRFADIQYVDTHHEIFSSQNIITLGDPEEELPLHPGFIAMDPPVHGGHRKVVQPVVAPANLATLEPLIRSRVVEILESLPVDEEFNWVERVSVELTTRMLATLFDFPFEERAKLLFWSNMFVTSPSSGQVEAQVWKAAMMECLERFTALWNERVNKPVSDRLDLITMLAKGESTRNMTPMEYLGTLALLIVGGNDTTRNSITGGVLAMNEYPDQFEKLKRDPSLIPGMVSETIRWQTPLAHMRRTATVDTELAGKHIKQGDKVVMWYISGNRDEREIENPDAFIIDRPKPRHHISFGYGIHRCMGNRLAEMQLRIVWEEILNHFSDVRVVGEPARIASNFVHGYASLPVVVTKAG